MKKVELWYKHTIAGYDFTCYMLVVTSIGTGLLCLFFYLEYINHLLQFVENISYYAGIMLNAFNDLLCLKLCWHNRLVPTHLFIHLPCKRACNQDQNV